MGKESLHFSGTANPLEDSYRQAPAIAVGTKKKKMDSAMNERVPAIETAADTLQLDDQVAHLLRRAHQRASAIYLGVLSERQITPTQFFAMARLSEMGQLSQNRLGRLAAMDPATIQGVIQRLAERGHIQRLPDPTDRRRMVLSLTPSGQALVAELLGRIRQVNADILSPLSESEQLEFVALLRKLA